MQRNYKQTLEFLPISAPNRDKKMNLEQASLIAKHKKHPGFENMVIHTLKQGSLFMTKAEASIIVAQYLEKEQNRCKTN